MFYFYQIILIDVGHGQGIITSKMLLQTMRHKKIVCIVECNRKNNKITKNEKEEQYKNNFLVGNQKKNINSLNMPSNHKSLSTTV